ncbi:Exodeoxyribonuclease V, gamma subunit [uncultured Desulfobacterium sp.]|uniref:Exodeoxyribonuclease V, gamma subunit n=1 Tax=uncultured Desulfobacterium sp. TaxID=201089 RepID=A0A445N3I9_9BACT|nr:Exodeoxyribonuclease V, gamma subunit [uncultured Desulfobacterium sp.]
MSDLNLRLFTSNRLEILADQLAGVISSPLSSVFDAEIIVVQSRGMERWLSMEMALRHGVCANIRFPFPNAFINQIAQQVFSTSPEQSGFEPKMMMWRIMGILPSLLQRPGFEPLKGYLGKEHEGMKLFQLSSRVADLFDQYLLFRPEMVLGWEKGMEHHWQAVLWRELIRGSNEKHRAALGKALIEVLSGPSFELRTLPERISVFGISTLPVFHLQVFAAISRFSQVNLFLMNPCMEYWGDIFSDREMKRISDRGQGRNITHEDLHMEKGNSLLVSMGRLGRDFFDIINEFDCEDIQSFDQQEETSLLASIQSDILNLREPGKTIGTKTLISSKDKSIQVHSCHSPMREVEVLHDMLLDILEKDQELKPRDILVMTPDIEVYAPYIKAVFDGPADDATRIPFSVADQSVKREGRIIEIFLGILALADGRFSAPEVMAVLEAEAVHKRFGFSEPELDLVRKWVEDTLIRWGIDAEDRGLMGLPDLPENTWKAGLERLLLGYAMMAKDDKTFAGVYPYDNMEGGDTAALGKFMDFADGLSLFVRSIILSRTLSEWSDTLTDMLDRFFLADDDTENEIQLIRKTLKELAEKETLAGFKSKVDVNVIKSHLTHCFSMEGFGLGFISGGVTFCAMLPMRSIPFKIICLIGMDHDAYPGQSRPLGFDLMARHPKKGDRSKKNDDRYLFLEAIVSARKTLHVSYVGQDIRDNKTLLPSVLVTELMDYIGHGFMLQGNIRDHIHTTHRLQPFSPEYFKKGGRLFSFSKENFYGARRLLEPRDTPPPFISKGLSQPGEEWKELTVEDLCGFFINPARFLLNRRLGLYLDEDSSRLEDIEPLELGSLEQYILAGHIVEKSLAGGVPESHFDAVKAQGILPHGAVGRCAYDRLKRSVDDFSDKMRPYIREGTLAALDVDIDIAGFHLTGVVSGIYPERLLRYRQAGVKPKDRIRTWINHLILNAINPPGYPRTSMVAGLDGRWSAWEYLPVDNGLEFLTGLLEIYWQGLVKPIHFFPISSWQYAEALLEKQKHEEIALSNARQTWMGNDFMTGEKDDNYLAFCFADTDPIDQDFEDMAIEVYGPMLDYQKKV